MIIVKRNKDGEFEKASHADMWCELHGSTKFNISFVRLEEFLIRSQLIGDNQFVSQFEITDTGISVTAESHTG